MAGRDVVVKIIGDAASLERALKTARKDVGSFADESSRRMQRAGTVITAASVAGGAALISFAKDAGTLQRAIKATDTIFGDASGTIDSFAENSVDAAGLSERAYREMAARMGAQLKNLGRNHQEAADDTARLITLSADLAVGFGTTEQAAGALASLLRGERDPIEQFGIAIKQSDINARLAADGLSGLTGEQLKAAETTATMELLYEQAGDRIGMYADNADDAIGQQQRLNAEFENLRASIGEGVLPVLTDLLSTVNSVAEAFGDLDADTKKSAGELAGMLVTVGLLGGAAIKAAPHLKALSVALLGVESAALGGALAIGAIGAAIASSEKADALDGMGLDAPSLIEIIQGLNGTEKALDSLADAVISPSELQRMQELRDRFGDNAPRAWASGVRDAGAATRETATLTAELRDRLDEARESFEEFNDRMFGVEDAVDAYEDSVDDVIAAMDRLDEVQGDAESSARDVYSAQRDVEGAARDVLRAVGDAAAEFGTIDEGRAAFQNARDDIWLMSGALEEAGVDVGLLYEQLRTLERKFVAEIEIKTGAVPIIPLPHVPVSVPAGWTPKTRATGGPVSANQAYVVGENGRELFVPSTGGEIISNGRMGGGGGGLTQITLQIDGAAFGQALVDLSSRVGGIPIRLAPVV